MADHIQASEINDGTLTKGEMLKVRNNRTGDLKPIDDSTSNYSNGTENLGNINNKWNTGYMNNLDCAALQNVSTINGTPVSEIGQQTVKKQYINIDADNGWHPMENTNYSIVTDCPSNGVLLAIEGIFFVTSGNSTNGFFEFFNCSINKPRFYYGDSYAWSVMFEPRNDFLITGSLFQAPQRYTTALKEINASRLLGYTSNASLGAVNQPNHGAPSTWDGTVYWYNQNRIDTSSSYSSNRTAMSAKKMIELTRPYYSQNHGFKLVDTQMDIPSVGNYPNESTVIQGVENVLNSPSFSENNSQRFQFRLCVTYVEQE